MTEHATCDDPDCTTCNERERIAALDLQRKIRPGGSIRTKIAAIKRAARKRARA